MAQSIFNQITRHGGYTDVSMKNNGATAITAGLVVQYETSDTGLDYPHCKAIAAADTVTGLAGVAVETIAVGANGRVCVHGPAVALANGAITAGAFVQTLMSGGSCDGKAITLNLGATQEAVAIVGQAMTPAAGADDYLEVFVNIVPATTAA
jgi:hypothetical protein